MADRALFIGVGGSGGATLQYLYADLELRLRELGWNDGVPGAWQFLHIDATLNPDEGNRSVANELRDSRHYLPLTARETKFEDYTRGLIDNEVVAGGWLPGPNSAPQRIWTGAGQRRAVGRVLALSSMPQIYAHVRDLINETERPENAIELNLLTQTYLKGSPSETPDLEVFIITSLGGGSGSGMHQEISLMLRAAFPEASRHVSILYSPDIFESLASDTRKGVSPNSLAGMSEIVAAHFGEGGLTQAEVGALGGIPVSDFSSGTRAPHLAFFQGRSNGQVNLDTPGDVYRSTARTLTALLLNKENREQMKSYVEANLSPIESRKEFRSDANERRNDPEWQLGMAFGYTNVSLGMSAFKEYGARRLAAKVIAQVLEEGSNAHRLHVEQDPKFVQEAMAFARAVGLDESASAPGAPQGILTSAWVEPEALTSILRKLLEKVKDEPGRLRRSADTDGRKASDEKKSEFNQAVEIRVQRATERLIAKTLASVAEVGALSTCEYLSQLESDLKATSIRWNAGEGARVSKQAVSRPISSQPAKATGGFLSKIVGSIRGDNAPAASPLLREQDQLAAVVNPMGAEFQKYQTETLASVLSGFAVNVVQPIREAIESGRQELVSRLGSDAGLRDQIGEWPTETTQSPVRAAKNEIFLIEDSTFKDRFESLLAEQLQELDDAPFLQATDQDFAILNRKSISEANTYESVRPQALFEVLGGSSQRSDGDTSFWPSSKAGSQVAGKNARLKIDLPWRLSLLATARLNIETLKSTDLQNCLKVKFSIDPNVLLSDARLWMATRQGVDSLTNLSLADYLNGESADSLRRRNEFVAKFSTAILMARPMTEIDKRVLGSYHDVHELPSMTTTVSDIPIDAGSEAAKAISSLLQREGMDESSITFEGASAVSEVHITRFLGSQVNPVNMVNVMAPIVKEWELQRVKEKNDPKFWSCRRAHRLPAFVPLAPSVLHRMVKGWNLARSTSLISEEAVATFLQQNGPLEFSANGQEHRFPERLLTTPDPATPTDLFPALLESFVIGIIDIAAGRPESIEAYATLSEIGKNSEALIAEYLRSGTLCGYSDASVVELSVEDRLNRLKSDLLARSEEVNKQKSKTEALGGSRADDRTTFGLTWELHEVTVKALEQLIAETTLPSATRAPRA
jgi:hypothetical protein